MTREEAEKIAAHTAAFVALYDLFITKGPHAELIEAFHNAQETLRVTLYAARHSLTRDLTSDYDQWMLKTHPAPWMLKPQPKR